MQSQGLLIAIRLLTAIGGGYAATAGLTALAALSLQAIMPRSEAVVLASMLAFPAYLAILIWAFAERRLAHLFVVLAGAGLVSWGGVLSLACLTGRG